MNGNWKVGELAKRTGTTIRTLHHYDRIGLLSPSRTTESGHRLYTDADVVKLHYILSLKQLGFALEEIKAMIHNPSFRPEEMLELQLSRLNKQIGILTELKDRVQYMLDRFHSGQPIPGERFMLVMQMMRMMQSPHFSKGLADELERWSKRFGPDELEHIHEEGQILLNEFRSCLNGGKPPDDPEVAELPGAGRQKWMLTPLRMKPLFRQRSVIMARILKTPLYMVWTADFTLISRRP